MNRSIDFKQGERIDLAREKLSAASDTIGQIVTYTDCYDAARVLAGIDVLLKGDALSLQQAGGLLGESLRRLGNSGDDALCSSPSLSNAQSEISTALEMVRQTIEGKEAKAK